MKLRTKLGAAVFAAALVTGVGATSAQAAYQTGHLVQGPTMAACQTSLNNAVNTYANAGKTVTHVAKCVRNNATKYTGAVFVRTY